MRIKMALLVLLFGTWPAHAADLPEPVLPQGAGVNIHFARGHTQDLDLIAAAGFKLVRMDFTWAAIERTEGQYDWSAYDELTANLEKRGLRAVYILDYSNTLYEEMVEGRNPITGRSHRDVASPRHPRSIAAFARWAGAAATHYRGRRIIWEIWNEPNITFWKPKPDVHEYSALVLATGKAIREADPQATLVAPASSGVPRKFLEDLFAAGALSYLDAVSVHPYREYHRPPESAAEDYHSLRRLIEQYAPERKKTMPILSGEWGYASHRGGVSPDRQAAFLVRQQLANLLEGVPLSIWYDWKDDGTNPDEHEENFGTVHHDLSPKPAYRAMCTLTRELSGYRVVRRLESGSASDFLLLLKDAAGHRKLAAWTQGPPSAVQLARDLIKPAGTIRGVTFTGEAFAPVVAADSVVLDLTEAPRYVTLDDRPR